MAQLECEHRKVFAGYVLTSNPPQLPWVCSKCLQKGSDRYPAQTHVVQDMPDET